MRRNLKNKIPTSENNRPTAEIEVLRKTLEKATKQDNDIAIKVIESSTKSPVSETAAVD